MSFTTIKPPVDSSASQLSGPRWIDLKGLVFCVLVGGLMLVISLFIAFVFAASIPLTYFVTPGAVGIAWGLLLVIIMSKCPKIGAVIIPFLIYGVYMFVLGSVYILPFFIITGIISELVLLGRGRNSVTRGYIPPLLMTLSNAMGGTLTMLLFRDNMLQVYMSMGMDAKAADTALSALEAFWLAPQNIALAVVFAAVGALVGYLVGVKLLKKHFRPAGAV